MTNKYLKKAFYVFGAIFIFACAASAQTTEFTFQGKLTDTGTPSATYDFEFRLCDSETDCTTPLAVQQRLAVSVSNGAFTVKLDFGAANFDGSNRWLEIAVKRPSEETFTTLAPRQSIGSSPYSIKSKSADLAFNSAQLGGIPASNYLLTNGDGSGLTNLNGANITNNTIPATALASDTFPNNRNLSLLGMLRWNQLGQRVSVGAQPTEVAFDGANIWVANHISNNVTKL